MTENQQIGARIKELRLKNNLTQQQLADKLHYKSRSTINKIELGINEIHPTKLRGFAYALNTSMEYILGWRKDPNVYENKIDIMLANGGGYMKYTFDDIKIEKVIKFLNDLEQSEWMP